MQIERVVYGEGGFDPDKPDGNVVEREVIEVDDPQATPGVDPAAVEQAKTQLAKATTINQVKAALGPLLDAL